MAVEAVKKDVLFSEVTGLGDSTTPAPEEEPEAVEDLCCERFEENLENDEEKVD